MKLIHELRGLRNNNPGNLQLPTSYVWDGQIIDPMPEFYLDDKPYKPKQEKRFCRFISMDWGICTIFRILRMYKDKYGLDTIEGIINRYAPPSENDTEHYIQQVCVLVGKTKDKPLDYYSYPFLVKAIIKHENGFCPFTTEYIKTVFVWAVPEWQLKNRPQGS